MKVSNVKFYLKNPLSSAPTAIYLKVQLNRKSFKYYVRESIHPEYWDYENGRPISDKSEIKKLQKKNPTIEIELRNLRHNLSDLANRIVSTVSLRKHQGERVHSEELKQDLNSYLGSATVSRKRNGIIEYLDEYIETIETGKRTTSKGTRFALGTVKNYRGLRAILIKFESESQRQLIFDQFDIDRYRELVKWLQLKNLSLNTVGRHVKQLKAVFRYAHQDGTHNNEVYKDSRFLVFKVPSDEISLTNEEIERIRLLDLSDTPRLDLIRDVFLLGCYTALRYSDYSRISPEHISEGEYGKLMLTIHNKKTDIKTTVPLRTEAVAILKKYRFKLPKTYEQKVNKGIKEIGQLAGIDNQIVIMKYRGVDKVKETRRKYEMIKTHTARRSAATNMYKAGISTVEIMKITGHKSEKTFFRYINVTDEEVARRLSNHPYFN